MLSKTGNKTFELTLFIAIMLILPVWISADYALDFLSEFHCQSPILILACGYHRPERTAILASLSIFHFAVVIGNISVAWLLYHRRLLVALFVSMAVCDFSLLSSLNTLHSREKPYAPSSKTNRRTAAVR